MDQHSSSMVGNKRSFSESNNGVTDQDYAPMRNSDTTSNLMLEMIQSAANQSLLSASCNSVNPSNILPFGVAPSLLLLNMNQYMTNPYFQAQLLAANSSSSPFAPQIPTPLMGSLSAASMVPPNIPDSTSNLANLSLFFQNPAAFAALKGIDPTLLAQQSSLIPSFNPMLSLMGLPQPMAVHNFSSGSMMPMQFSLLPTSSNHLDNSQSVRNSSADGDDDSSKNDKNQRGRIRWTKHMDELLLQAFEMYKDCKIGMWKKVAQYVSAHLTMQNPTPEDYENCQLIVTNHQCGERYKHHLHPDIQYKKSGPWTDEEIEQLKQLVSENQVVVEGVTSLGRSKSQVNWIKVSETLNRNYRDCQHKWTAVSKSAMKKGVFTKEEEDLILSVVEERGDTGATWNMLENELGRKRRSIQDKYNYLKKRKKGT